MYMYIDRYKVMYNIISTCVYILILMQIRDIIIIVPKSYSNNVQRCFNATFISYRHIVYVVSCTAATSYSVVRVVHAGCIYNSSSFFG